MMTTIPSADATCNAPTIPAAALPPQEPLTRTDEGFLLLYELFVYGKSDVALANRTTHSVEAMDFSGKADKDLFV